MSKCFRDVFVAQNGRTHVFFRTDCTVFKNPLRPSEIIEAQMLCTSHAKLGSRRPT